MTDQYISDKNTIAAECAPRIWPGKAAALRAPGHPPHFGAARWRLPNALRRITTIHLLRPAAALIAALLLASASWAAAENRFAVAGTDEAAVSRFIVQLQQAVKNDERKAVAALFSCPCRVWDGSKTQRIKTAEQLLPLYGSVFDAQLKQLIAAARTEELFVNGEGVMIGDGRLWFTAFESPRRLGIITINPPQQAGTRK